MKVLILQLHNNSYGGIWQVNKMIGEGFIKRNIDCKILCLRDNNKKIDLDTNLDIEVINSKDEWVSYGYSDAIKSFSIKKIIKRINNDIKLISDKKILNNFISEYNPDLIIVSNYVFLDLISSKYYNKVYYEQHSSFYDVLKNKGNIRTLDKYKDKIKYIFLCNNTLNKALEYGFNNSICIYNPVRFTSNSISDVNNKRLVCISRLAKCKRIDLMIRLVNDILSMDKYKDWCLDIYGDGGQYNILSDLIKELKCNNIRLMGVTNDPMSVYLNSDINLSTSSLEGFPMSILEGYECGVPCISFDFGESISEVILDNKTGFIVNNNSDFKDKLMNLMDNNSLLKEFSINSKEYSKNFYIDNIIDEWIKLIK